MRTSIINGHIIDPANGIDEDGSLYIEDGKIIALHEPEGFQPDNVIDAKGLMVCPGLIDLQARLREPGQEPKADIASETAAAAKGGITTLCVPPDTDPVIDTPAVAELIEHHAQKAGKARVLTIGALTKGLKGNQLSEMAALKSAGCVGVSNGWQNITDTQVRRRSYEYAASQDLTVFINANDHYLMNQGCAHEGQVSTRLGLLPIPESAETSVVARDLILIEEIGVRAHFSQLSTQRSVKMIGRAQYDSLPITADVSAHQLHLTEMDLAEFNNYCHVIPPLRTQRDLEGLRQALVGGIVQGICSDHQPHEDDVKLAPFGETEPGISGLETLLPLSLRLVHEGVIGLSQCIQHLTDLPAKILNIQGGNLSVGQQADVCLFDPNMYWTVDNNSLISRGKNTPFKSWELKGQVVATLFQGKLVYQHSRLKTSQ